MAFNTYPTNYFIRQHGSIMTLRKRESGEYDVETGSVNFVENEYSVYGYSSKTIPSSLTGQSVVVNGRVIFLISKQINGEDLPAPVVNDQIDVDDFTVNVTEVDVVKSNGKVIYYLIKT